MADHKPAGVLIVDDDKGLARVMERVLGREGIIAKSVNSGKEALRYLQTETPELVLLDLQLGDFAAQELIERLEVVGVVVPFIIITGQGDERVAVEMMKRGALDYLVKDVQFLEFVPTVVRNALVHLDNKRRLAAAEEERHRLEREILEISEREQRRIGQDLHDDLGQQLAGLWCLSQVLHENLAHQQLSQAADAAQISALLKGALALTRSLAKGLHPVSDESGGLISALNDLSQRVSDTFRVQCRCSCDVTASIDDKVATHLYRIAQEAVSNAIKHGKAKEIEIDLTADASQVALSIRDYGTGIPATGGRGGGIGMRIMRYRADVIGGRFDIVDRGDGHGTVVSCTIRGAVPG